MTPRLLSTKERSAAPRRSWMLATKPEPDDLCRAPNLGVCLGSLSYWSRLGQSLVVLACFFLYLSGPLKMLVGNQLYGHGHSMLSAWLLYQVMEPGPGCFVGESSFPREELASVCQEDLCFYLFLLLLIF